LVDEHADTERPRSLFFESSDVVTEQEDTAVDESEPVFTTPENPLPAASVAQPEYVGVQQQSVVVESKTNEQDRPEKAPQEAGSLTAARAEQVSPLTPEEATPQVAIATAEVQPRTVSAQEASEQPPADMIEARQRAQTAQQEMYARQQEAALPLAQPEQAPVRPMSTAPERVVVAGLTSTDRLRMRQMERREKDIEKHTRAIKKDLERRPQSPNTIRPRVESAPTYVDRTVTRTPEVVPRTAEKQTIREIQKEIVNKRIDLVSEREEVNTAEAFKATEKVSDVQKERIIESMYDKVDTKEVEDHKEITYELSHEAKDMDGQTAAAWNAMQASADAQAKANAAAIAAAHAAVGNQADGLKQVAKNQAAAMYKQAALGGFVAAVVIIAIIIAILLLQSK
jgi:hypothetical protein